MKLNPILEAKLNSSLKELNYIISKIDLDNYNTALAEQLALDVFDACSSKKIFQVILECFNIKMMKLASINASTSPYFLPLSIRLMLMSPAGVTCLFAALTGNVKLIKYLKESYFLTPVVFENYYNSVKQYYDSETLEAVLFSTMYYIALIYNQKNFSVYIFNESKLHINSFVFGLEFNLHLLSKEQIKFTQNISKDSNFKEDIYRLLYDIALSDLPRQSHTKYSLSQKNALNALLTTSSKQLKKYSYVVNGLKFKYINRYNLILLLAKHFPLYFYIKQKNKFKNRFIDSCMRASLGYENLADDLSKNKVNLEYVEKFFSFFNNEAINSLTFVQKNNYGWICRDKTANTTTAIPQHVLELIYDYIEPQLLIKKNNIYLKPIHLMDSKKSFLISSTNKNKDIDQSIKQHQKIINSKVKTVTLETVEKRDSIWKAFKRKCKY